MSNMSRPTRPGRCTWAIAAARWSATRSPACSQGRATASPSEYYVNDAGAQVDALARSAYLRYREALGEDIGEIPEGLYPGDYLKPVGAALAGEYGDRCVDKPEERVAAACSASVAVAAMMADDRQDLACSASSTTFRVGARAVERRARSTAPRGAARAGPGLPGRARAAQGPRQPDEWEPRADPVPLHRSSATTRTGR